MSAIVGKRTLKGMVMGWIATTAAGFAAAFALAGAAQAQCTYSAGAATIAVPGKPFAVEATADGCWLFAALTEGAPGGGGAVAVLKNDGGGFRLVRVVPVRGQPGGLTLTHDGRTLIVAAWTSVERLDVAKLQTPSASPVLETIAVEKDAHAVYVATSLDDRLLFISQEGLARIDVVQLAPGGDLALGAIDTGRAPVGLVLSADGTRLYATSQVAPDASGFPKRCKPPTPGPDRSLGALAVIDVKRAAASPESSVLALVAAGCSPVRVALSPDGASAWVTARGDNALLQFSTGRIADPPQVTAVGPAPVGVTPRPDGKEVWVSNSDRFSSAGAGFLSMVRAAGGAGRTAPSGRFPRDMRFLPDGRTLVVAEFDSHALQLVPTD